MASVLATLVNLVQGYIELGARVLIFFSFFLLVLQLRVAILLMTVGLSGQSIDCRPNVGVRRCMHVRGTIILYFHAGGLIVSYGAYGGLGDQI